MAGIDRFCALAALASAFACTVLAAPALAQAAPEIPRFSAGKADGVPAGWEHATLASFKVVTEYTLAPVEGALALKASARNGASFLGTKTDFDPHQFPQLTWRWKVVKNVAGADTRDRRKEDSPARVMISFAGDKSKLSFKDRAAATTAQAVSGLALPYAELMYIWGSKVAVDSITTSAHTSRVRMLAVAVDDEGVGQWQTYSRNLVEDFKRAFGEEPGNVVAIKVMADTDNTGGDAETWFGDIRVQGR